MNQAYKRAIIIHTVAGKLQIMAAGTAAPVSTIKKITMIDLWIYEINMCFLLAFQIRSKLRKNS
jgi:hypothetical protein